MATVLDPPKLYRRTADRAFGGVAGGIADHLRISVVAVRLAFVVLAAAGGLGVILYAVFWIVVPAAPGPDGSPPTTAAEYAAAVVVAIVALAAAAWTTPFGEVFIPASLGCLGAALLWRQAGNGQREHWLRISRTSLTTPSDDGWGRVRVVAGAGLVVIGCVAVLPKTNFAALRNGLEAVVVTIVGVALITGPWWVRTVTDLADERRERIRSQERADLAAHLHDSVLQTLALIQRNASSPREVARLARGQERELRRMLYAESDPSGWLSDAVRAAAAEVEDSYGIVVDTVLVGDIAVDDKVAALVGAAREALVNAAKHAGVSTVSLYVEVEQAAVVAYVRDRGPGFDLGAVADDRQGVRGSIIARAERHDGTVTIRSQAGEGTEVTVRMPK